MRELKPCPFCESAVELCVAPNGLPGPDGQDYWIECMAFEDGGCETRSGVYHTAAEAVTAWNTRTTDKLVEAAEAVLRWGNKAGLAPGYAFQTPDGEVMTGRVMLGRLADALAAVKGE